MKENTANETLCHLKYSQEQTVILFCLLENNLKSFWQEMLRIVFHEYLVTIPCYGLP